MSDGGVWAVVMAGGDGSRLKSLTTDLRGRVVPKQFCSPDGGESLFRLALRRARSIAQPERVCAIVVADHWQWWEPFAREFPAGNLVVQSADRGTGNAVLLAALTILRRDPQARIVFLPSDHYAERDAVLTLAARDALDGLVPGSPDVVLVGVTPEDADLDVGYLVPPAEENLDSRGLECLVQPRDREQAQALVARGALWNSMIFAARATAIVALFIPHHPGLVARMQVLVGRCDDPCSPPIALEDLYERLPSIDFATEMLQPLAHQLRVCRAPACGWIRLTTPRSVQAMVLRMPHACVPARRSGTDRIRRLPDLRDALTMPAKRRAPVKEEMLARA